MTKKLSRNRAAAYTALFVALGVVVPYAAGHAFGVPGTVLLPMHLPVFLAGLVVGWHGGLAVGLLAPLLSSLITGMPPMFPMLPIMMAELPVYGIVAGLLHGKFKLKLYLAIPPAMFLGRMAYWAMFAAVSSLSAEPIRALTVWAAFTTGLPGIIIQLVLLPPLVEAISNNFRYRLPVGATAKAVAQAKGMVRRGQAALLVIKRGKLQLVRTDAGIAAALEVYRDQRGLLHKSLVVDKVVGKAAAAVFVLAGVKEVFAFVLSLPAKQLLQRHGITVRCETLVDVIKNRRGDGMCPMEQAVANISDAQAAFEAVHRQAASRREPR